MSWFLLGGFARSLHIYLQLLDVRSRPVCSFCTFHRYLSHSPFVYLALTAERRKCRMFTSHSFLSWEGKIILDQNYILERSRSLWLSLSLYTHSPTLYTICIEWSNFVDLKPEINSKWLCCQNHKHFKNFEIFISDLYRSIKVYFLLFFFSKKKFLLFKNFFFRQNPRAWSF